MRQSRYHLSTMILRRSLQGWLAVMLAVGAAACSRADNATPVASLSVTPVTAEISSEGVIELRYRFEALPGASVPAGYRVFVHLVTPDGVRLWGDDHDPPVPTGEWKSGQAVEYTRTAFLPVLTVDPGTSLSVVVGLYLDADRMPLQGTSPNNDRSYAAATLRVAPDAARMAIIYTGGWHPNEFSPDGLQSWKWTQRTATWAFRNPKKDVTVFLEHDARPDVFGGSPQQVTIGTASASLATFAAAVSDRPTLVRVPIPAAALGTAEMAELRLEIDKVFVPAELPAGGKDTRQLGIRVYHLVVDGR
jgi:hypothetical protein